MRYYSITSHAHQNLIFVSAREKRSKALQLPRRIAMSITYLGHIMIHFSIRPVLPTADPLVFLTQFHFQIETQLSVLNASPTGGVLRRMKRASKMNYHLDNSMRAHVSERLSSTPAEFDAAPGISLDTRTGSLHYQNHIRFSVSYDGNTVWSAVSEQILLVQRAGCVRVCFCLAAEFTRSPC